MGTVLPFDGGPHQRERTNRPIAVVVIGEQGELMRLSLDPNETCTPSGLMPAEGEDTKATKLALAAAMQMLGMAGR